MQPLVPYDGTTYNLSLICTLFFLYVNQQTPPTSDGRQGAPSGKGSKETTKGSRGARLAEISNNELALPDTAPQGQHPIPPTTVAQGGGKGGVGVGGRGQSAESLLKKKNAPGQQQQLLKEVGVIES